MSAVHLIVWVIATVVSLHADLVGNDLVLDPRDFSHHISTPFGIDGPQHIPLINCAELDDDPLQAAWEDGLNDPEREDQAEQVLNNKERQILCVWVPDQTPARDYKEIIIYIGLDGDNDLLVTVFSSQDLGIPPQFWFAEPNEGPLVPIGDQL